MATDRTVRPRSAGRRRFRERIATRGTGAILPGIVLVVALGCGDEPLEDDSIRRVDASVPPCEVGEGDQPDRPGALTTDAEIVADTLATGLEVPWDVTFLPDGRALVTERPGRIRVVAPDGRLLEEPWAELDVLAVDEVGLMGIDAAPDFEESGHVFVALTTQDLGSGISRILRAIGRRLVRLVDPGAGYTVSLEIVRITDRSARGTDTAARRGTDATTVAELPSGRLHGGGALRFGPDGFLYVTTGDTSEPRLAVDSDALRGKVLRYGYEDGEITPAGTDDGPIWAGGIRHAQGLAWRPPTDGADGPDGEDGGSDAMYLIEHGPTGLPQEDGRTGDDELNRVPAGADLGWPEVAGGSAGGGVTSPLATWNPAIAPAGLEFYTYSGGSWHGDAFVTALRGRSLRRLETTPEAPPAVACEEVLMDGTHGRLRLIRQAPDGSLWVGTSNRDGRGRPRPEDDMLLRVRPPTSGATASESDRSTSLFSADAPSASRELSFDRQLPR